ncbi:3-hydroxyacyl-CoA dehydrogenase NAD-binding domain-containing protein [Phaeobacter sp. PT47_59]|uniref:3-hydroxyacyl-CoA dehydrogenase NAD-binding domain-containing protein n=1 Tax=Phaeobacter sp. PT47_59 TaxID=3029979 RepID=UPI002380C1BC|nr:3-hydroxyacyl-CoA dehydrogenase NAD-binding domain-containing protein [Phaeobacter sp. PT47_59]MDE4172525.1 3-hydroxyacyl-CoA dehydrogenase NAD-binding domain-containing protein [Phaeobacter sp. PT47_59]
MPGAGHPIRKVTVVGAGLIGSSWAALFLQHGLDVIVTDLRPEAEASLLQSVAGMLHEHALAPERLRFDTDLGRACDGADFVQECAIERREAKIALFRDLDAYTRPGVLLASSSSALSVSEMQSACVHPGRVVLGHPFNPPHLVPLVEIGGGAQTEPNALQRAEAFYASLGKVPVRIDRETYGHIANRLQAAVFREAIHLLDSGIASVEAIDAALSEGPGLRWAFMGPFLAYHMGGGTGGIDGFWKMFKPMQRRLFAELGQPELDDAQIARVSRAVQDAYGQAPPHDLLAARDAFLHHMVAVKAAGGKTDTAG